VIQIRCNASLLLAHGLIHLGQAPLKRTQAAGLQGSTEISEACVVHVGGDASLPASCALLCLPLLRQLQALQGCRLQEENYDEKPQQT
jgi:hypothetical protein